jgi:hypothetical protein
MKRRIEAIVGLGWLWLDVRRRKRFFPAASIYKEGCPRWQQCAVRGFKARKVGDIITNLIAESSSASETSKVDTQKSHNLDFALTHLFGAGKLLFGKEDGQEIDPGEIQREKRIRRPGADDQFRKTDRAAVRYGQGSLAQRESC